MAIGAIPSPLNISLCQHLEPQGVYTHRTILGQSSFFSLVFILRRTTVRQSNFVSPGHINPSIYLIGIINQQAIMR